MCLWFFLELNLQQLGGRHYHLGRAGVTLSKSITTSLGPRLYAHDSQDLLENGYSYSLRQRKRNNLFSELSAGPLALCFHFCLHG